MTFFDIIEGAKIGKLTVIEKTTRGMVMCECECGNLVERSITGLINKPKELGFCMACTETTEATEESWADAWILIKTKG